jgi:hypothetical protein
MLPTKFHFIWLMGFQRRRLKCEKLTDDRRRTPSDGKSSHCLWQGELKMGVHESIMTILDGDQIFLLIIQTTNVVVSPP